MTLPTTLSDRPPRSHAPDGAATPAHEAIAVRFEAVTRRFGAVTALDAIDLSIATGETVALLGPNGAGKSTAIGLLLGLLEPTSGTVRTLGLTPAAAVASGRIGSMLQGAGLPANARVGELVDFARRLYPHPLARATIIERAGLGALTGRSVETLSGGEAQRVRFAIAIAGDPDLVFLDEPTVAMDVETRRAFWADMRRSAGEGRTILFATHYLEEADQVADRVVVLDRGRIVADGSSRSIRARVRGRTVRFDSVEPDPARLATLPGVSAVDIRGATISLATTDADATVAALVTLRVPIRDLEVTGADLEDAFVALTSASDEPKESSR
ncbi:MAG TPA: ABC transporter ATP-binding protein [Candidatus Limnocylindrales bacterium]|jgi:ABC-2 type transport system ATP-binding protein|nr:ABC transporter ATP-binding protein [Candidatus Limnocylindrales bacterium]